MKRRYRARRKGLVAWLARPVTRGYLLLAVCLVMAFGINAISLLETFGLATFDTAMDSTMMKQPPSIGFLRALLTRKAEPEPAGPRPGDIFGRSAARARREHLLGTNRRGQDLLALIVHGSRAFALPGAIAVLISLGLGIAFGILDAFVKGTISRLGHGLTSLIHAIPRLLILLIAGIVSRFDIYWIMVTLGLINFPKIAGAVHAKVAQLERMQFIEAARELGMSRLRIVFRHILWTNCRHILFIQAAFGMADAIYAETTLSYLGFGANQASWGLLIFEGSEFISAGQYWMAVLPALGVIITVLGYYLIGDGLNAIRRARENL